MRMYAIIMTLTAMFIAMTSFAAGVDSNFLSDRHIKEYGLECEGCHGKDAPTSELMDASHCLSCHESYEALSELTDKVDPNPHKALILMCDGCHQFDLKIK